MSDPKSDCFVHGHSLTPTQATTWTHSLGIRLNGGVEWKCSSYCEVCCQCSFSSDAFLTYLEIFIRLRKLEFKCILNYMHNFIRQ